MLDRVQSMGLRIISDTMRSTPIQEMEKIGDLQLWNVDVSTKLSSKGEKLKRLISHPLHQKLEHGTKISLIRKCFKH